MSHWNNEHALSYDEKWGELAFHTEIPTLAGVADNFRIAEIGCGGGYLSMCLAQSAEGVQVLALDPTDTMIERAKSRQKKSDLRFPQLQFIKAGAEELQVNTGSLDLVIAAFSIHHWQNAELALSLIFQGLKRGGRIWLCEDVNAPSSGDLMVDVNLKTFSGVKERLQSVGFESIVKNAHVSSEGEFLIIEALKRTDK
ncbi:class I SAM-dependent methyltransferase [Pseudoalteromonas aurantia]|uniref:Methyltransferase type 11 domain-containing protein n=1 Tax=Pseudoalteromonas aurantia 208 TaxID=1314867 RepID=A0ABR9EJ38_9GAMM|nr:class I SAM-dependent methyltransferase [Pseudoalteromonas aurantia]MBE0370444.1 hypothetical protein [Pseudoalteromonas aurantia 208]